MTTQLALPAHLPGPLQLAQVMRLAPPRSRPSAWSLRSLDSGPAAGGAA